MRTYRINCTDDADRVVASHKFTCRGDLEALDKAQELCRDHGVEVREGERRVVWMHKGGAVRFESPSVLMSLPVDLFDTDPFAGEHRMAN